MSDCWISERDWDPKVDLAKWSCWIQLLSSKEEELRRIFFVSVKRGFAVHAGRTRLVRLPDSWQRNDLDFWCHNQRKRFQLFFLRQHSLYLWYRSWLGVSILQFGQSYQFFEPFHRTQSSVYFWSCTDIVNVFRLIKLLRSAFVLQQGSLWVLHGLGRDRQWIFRW